MNINDMRLSLWTIAYFTDKLTIVSGGQNGVDQAALFAAKELGVTTGGWMPRNWVTLDGAKPHFARTYGMKEADKSGYAYRTKLNVRDSDVTIRFATDFSSHGEVCTWNAAKACKKFVIDFKVPEDLTNDNLEKLVECIRAESFYILNIAGNSEKTSPGINKLISPFLEKLFKLIITK